MGLPTIFIRLTGCNLRCKWCDTTYSYYEGQEYSIEEIIEITKNLGIKRVCITGGEPLIQKDLGQLLDKLLENDYSISIETNGSQPIEWINKKIMISLDIKCPSSMESDKMKFSNLEHLSFNDQCKFIIEDVTDYNFSLSIIKEYNLIKKTNVIFNPVGGIKARELVDMVVQDNIDVRVGIQLHKIIWDKNTRGV
ncbi:MAG: hypothetical protein A2355_04700 [Spirochaetes bacterium RIFOXYB1_FULL_32_8]|nr:MAG: hypothetical protein A2355_04700 [Spirochaetes bacterium RIFOXYB1_FULL_32_8]